MIVRQPGAMCMHRVPFRCVGVERNVLGPMCVHDTKRRQQELGEGQQRYRDTVTTTTMHVTGLLKAGFVGAESINRHAGKTNVSTTSVKVTSSTRKVFPLPY